MSVERGSAFTFVDRILALTPGHSARGIYLVPRQLAEFPACLVAEAVGQLAAWVAMQHTAFALRPVAALATEVRFERSVAPGEQLDLSVRVESCDQTAIAYSGDARVAGSLIAQLRECVGPLQATPQFDDLELLRRDFHTLCAHGSPAQAFPGAKPLWDGQATMTGNAAMHAGLVAPATAPFFADHFPRKPVLPATLLLDVLLQLASILVRRVSGEGDWRPTCVQQVKLRRYVEPGQELQLVAELASSDDVRLVKVSASSAGQRVANAQARFARSDSKH